MERADGPDEFQEGHNFGLIRRSGKPVYDEFSIHELPLMEWLHRRDRSVSTEPRGPRCVATFLISLSPSKDTGECVAASCAELAKEAGSPYCLGNPEGGSIAPMA